MSRYKRRTKTVEPDPGTHFGASIIVFLVGAVFMFKSHKFILYSVIRLQNVLYNIDIQDCILFLPNLTLINVLHLLFTFVAAAFACLVFFLVFDRKYLKQSLKGLNIFLLGMAVIMFLIITSFSYIKLDGVHDKQGFIQKELFYSWDKIVEVRASAQKTRTERYLRFDFILNNGRSFTISDFQKKYLFDKDFIKIYDLLKNKNIPIVEDLEFKQEYRKVLFRSKGTVLLLPMDNIEKQ